MLVRISLLILITLSGCDCYRQHTYFCYKQSHGFRLEGEFGTMVEFQRPSFGNQYIAYGTLENTTPEEAFVSQVRILYRNNTVPVDSFVVQAGGRKQIEFSGNDVFTITDINNRPICTIRANVIQRHPNGEKLYIGKW